MLDITWLGHGTFLLALGSGETILIDPWLDGNPTHPKGYSLKRVDTLLLTHGHFDHIADAVAVAKKFRPKVIANFEICTWLASKGVEHTSGMNKGGSQDAGSIRVTMTHALHSSGIQDGDQMLYGGEAGGYILHLEGGRTAYFAGDTAVFSDMALYAELYAPELAFLPIGDLFTMDPKQAAMATRLLKVKTVVPMHFGTFPPLVGRPDALAKLVGDGVTVMALEPGKTTRWA